MRSLFSTVFLIVASGFLLVGQNIGQTGDSLVNYTDINGMKQGYWKKVYENGNIAYEGYFKNDEPIGNFKRYFEKGGLSTDLHYDEVTRICRARLFHENKKVAAVGNYYEKKKDSIWTYYTRDGNLIAKESYKMGLRHGKFYKYYSDGTLAEEQTFENDKQHGPWRRFYPNGNPRLETMYKNGKRHGLFYVYFENGRVQISGAYKNDVRDKSWVFYLKDGKIDYKMEYEKGNPKNPELLDERQRREFEEYERNRYKLRDPEHFINDPEKFLRGY
jgi:antitoxin component YwqK of YwqJK toxin-antitoxin module